jgi:hypothetical protein
MEIGRGALRKGLKLILNDVVKVRILAGLALPYSSLSQAVGIREVMTVRVADMHGFAWEEY